MSPLTYHVVHGPDDLGWVVRADGFVARSLPYDTRDRAIEQADLLVQRHPGSRVIVEDEAHPLARPTPAADLRW